MKYHFITAIEGFARIAHHVIASEGWRVAESNADAVRTLGVQRVVAAPTADCHCPGRDQTIELRTW